ncbi:class IV adenylate cyclase [Planctomycetota bacterium]
MCTEIEAKLKVDSLKQIEEILAGLGAEFLQQQQQIDYYLDDENRTLTKADKCLRLRREIVRDGETRFLTYKGPKQKDNFKKRQEIEIEITDANSAEKLLSAIGFKKALVVEKKRWTWRIGQCKVALDELPQLGTFVEIEGPDAEQIASVQKDLQLSDLPHIPESYVALIEKKNAE